MSAFLKVNWIKAERTEPRSEGYYSSEAGTETKPTDVWGAINELPCVKKRGKDERLIVFVRCSKEGALKLAEATKNKEGKSPKELKEAAVAATVAANQAKLANIIEMWTIGDDYRPRVACRFFTCYAVDVTNVKGTEDPFLCAAESPLIAVIGSDGKGKELWNKRITTNALYDSLRNVLLEDGINIAPCVQAIKPLIVKYRQVERDLSDANEDLAKTVKARSKSKSDLQPVKEQELVAKFTQERDEFLAKMNNALDLVEKTDTASK